MTVSKSAATLLVAFALAAGLSRSAIAQSRSAAAQSTITAADIQRLQDTIDTTAREIGQMRSSDPTLESQLRDELDTVSDDAIYLKVKLRRKQTVTRTEFADARDWAEDIRSRARDAASWSSGNSGWRPEAERNVDSWPTPNVGRNQTPNVGRNQNLNEIPVGAEFDVRLHNPLTSKTAQVEDRFEATTMVDLNDERGRLLVPAGSVMRGIVTSVTPATRMERKGKIVVAFDRLSIKGQSYPMRATVTQALESEGIAGEKEKIGIGAGAGAILGAILGGAKGALAGILIGGGGVIAATEGKDVELPSGTVLRVRLDAPLTLGR